MRKFSSKWVPKFLNADQKRYRFQLSEQHLELLRRDLSDFLSWPWTKPGYITMNQTRSRNQWNGGTEARPAPKNSECKNPLENCRLDFLVSRRHLLIDYLPKGQRSITHLCWCNGRSFSKTNAAGSLWRSSCSFTTMPHLTGHLPPWRNWPTWPSIILITHHIFRTWPCRTTTCSLDRKNDWKVAIFRPTWRSFLPRRHGWTDNFLIILMGLH